MPCTMPHLLTDGGQQLPFLSMFDGC